MLDLLKVLAELLLHVFELPVLGEREVSLVEVVDGVELVTGPVGRFEKVVELHGVLHELGNVGQAEKQLHGLPP